MELTEYKDKCNEDLRIYERSMTSQKYFMERAREVVNSERQRITKFENTKIGRTIQQNLLSNTIATIPHNNDNVNDGGQVQAPELRDRLVSQTQKIEKALEKIEEATDDFVLDPLESVDLTNKAYEVLKTVLKEEHQLLKILSTYTAMKDLASTCTVYPKVNVKTGIAHFLGAKQFMICRSGDVIIAGIDTLLDQWRLRRFNRLGRLEWDRPLPMSWTECHGIADFSRSEKAILLGNADRKKIILVDGDGRDTTLSFVLQMITRHQQT